MLYIGLALALLTGLFCGFLFGRQNSHFALRDPLTGLPNKPAFDKQLQSLLVNTPPERPFAILFLDIDHFKRVNDSHGHLAGDEILRQVAALLSRHCQPTNVFRWGGDEFTILVFGEQESVQQIAQQISEAVRQLSVTFQQQTIPLTVSIGVALHTPTEAGSDLLKRADQALYQAKSTGRDRTCWSDSRSH